MLLFIINSLYKFFICETWVNNKLYDDSASRAYYAVFHIISAILFTKGLTFTSHSQTLGNFNKEFIKTNIFPAIFSKKIEKLFKSRQIGDYDIDSIIDKKTALERIEFANEIVKVLKEYLSNLYKKSFN